MPTIERTTGYPAAHDFGAVGYPVIGVAGIAPPGYTRNGNHSRRAAGQAAPAAASSP